MTLVNNGTKKENKEVCVLIRVKPKYTEEFCIMMVACKELCKRVSKFKKLAKIDKAFSVLGPFDFLIELSEKKYLFSWNDTSENRDKLKKFLMEDFDVRWVKKLKSEWKDNTIVFADGKNKITLNMKRDKVTLRINDERTCEFVKKDGGTDIYRKEEEVDERINRTIFKIRKTLGNYIYETHTLTKFELSEFLEDECKKLYDLAESTKVGEKDELDKFKGCLEETLEILFRLRDRLEREKDGTQKKAVNDVKKYDSLEETCEKLFDTAESTKIEEKDEFKGYLEETLEGLCRLRDKLKHEKDRTQKKAVNDVKKYDSAESSKVGEKDELDEFKGCLQKETIEGLRILRDRLKREKDETQKKAANDVKEYDSLEETCEKLYDIAESTKIEEKDELGEFKGCLEETLNGLCRLRDRLEREKVGMKHVHVLIKVKPRHTKEFFFAMGIFKGLCKDLAPLYLAKIEDKTCSIFGQFDFIFELIAEGEEEEITKKINRTIFEIRETLGSCIYETHTIEKFKVPMTKEDLECFFKKKIGEENLVRLPHCDGEKVPHERYKPDDKIDLEEIYAAETTPLKKLLEKAKNFLDLNERIIDLNSRVEELEKR